MAQDNIDQVCRGMEHWLSTGEALWEDVDPEAEVHDHDIPDGGIYRGHDGFRDWIADFSAAFESFTLEPLEYIDAGDGKVVLVARLSARGKGSGAPVERLDGMVWTIRDGKTVRLDYYGSRAEAFEAAGLPKD